jgi:hypothetical protein
MESFLRTDILLEQIALSVATGGENIRNNAQKRASEQLDDHSEELFLKKVQLASEDFKHETKLDTTTIEVSARDVDNTVPVSAMSDTDGGGDVQDTSVVADAVETEPSTDTALDYSELYTM